MSVNKELNEIKKLLERAEARGLVKGLLAGGRVAERMFMRWATNHKLLDPHPNDLLEEWSNNELDALNNQIQRIYEKYDIPD